MSSSMTNTIVRDIKRSVQKKIEAGETDGDINEQLLILVSDVHDKMGENLEKIEDIEEEVEGIKKNWAFAMGEFVKNNKLVAWAVAQVTVLILVATSLAIGLGLIDRLGLALVVKP